MQKKVLIALAILALFVGWFLSAPSKADETKSVKPKVESVKDETSTTVAEATTLLYANACPLSANSGHSERFNQPRVFCVGTQYGC